MNYTRPIDAVEYCRTLNNEIAYIRENPEQYENHNEIINGLEIAIADLGDMRTVTPDYVFSVVYHFGPDGKSKLVSRVYDIDRECERFLIVDGWNKFHWASMSNCTLFEGWENYQEE